MTKKAVVLLSGGIDSATAAAIAKRDGYELFALSMDYNQRHRAELQAAATIAAHLGVTRHIVQKLDLRAFGGSALTDDIDVPKDRSSADIAHGIPITYVPARNTIFLSLALGWAEALGGADIVIGVNALDYSGYPDCRQEFIDAFRTMAMLGTRDGIEGRWPLKFLTPLISMTKAEIIKAGTALGLDYALTTSCYDPSEDGRACGHCDSCSLRRKGFTDAGLPDVTRYV
jgi:7-cyano-7-deazaguanine synthase